MAGAQGRVALHRAGEVEVVEHGGADLAKLGAVDGAPVGGAELLLLGQPPGEVERGKEVIIFKKLAHRALLIVARVADEFHAIVLEAHAGVDVHRADGERQPCIACGVEAAALIVVAQLRVVQHIKALFVKVFLLAEKPGNGITEIRREVVGDRVETVNKAACAIVAAAVFAIAAHAEFGFYLLALAKLEAVIERGRADVLFKESKLAVDVVGSVKLDVARFVLVVQHVAATVGHVAVGKGVAHAPVERVCAFGEFAR